MAVGAVHPTTAQDATSLAGRWTLNRELSQFPREAGFNADWLAHSNSSGESTPTPGSQGGASSGGNRTSFPVSRVSREDSMRIPRLLTNEARDPAAVLVITETATEVVITPDKGVALYVPPHREGRGPAARRSDCHRVIYPRSRAVDCSLQGEPGTGAPLHLLACRQPAATRGRSAVHRSRQGRDHQARLRTREVCRGPGQAAMPAAALATRPAGVPASGERGATQDYDRQPEAQFKGLTTLGVVVEGLGTQATTCGLRQEAIESAVVKQLSRARG